MLHKYSAVKYLENNGLFQCVLATKFKSSFLLIHDRRNEYEFLFAKSFR